jgi:uncharacterized protein (DUF885 family)
MRRTAGLLLALVVAGSVPSRAESPAQQVRNLADACWDGLLELRPAYATAIGDHRWDDRFPDGVSARWRDSFARLQRRCLEKASTIDPAALGAEDRTTLAVLIHDARIELEGLRYPEHLLPVSADLGSLPQAFARAADGDGSFRFASPADYEAFLARMNAFPGWVDVALGAMREGVRRRVVQPCSVTRLALEQLDEIAASRPSMSPFMEPLERLPGGIDRELRRRLKADWTTTVTERVLPAYRHLAEVMRSEYLPECRESLGLWALPDGRAWYAWRVRRSTTTELEPAEVFQLGAAEVSRIIAALEGEAKALGFHDGITGLYTALYSNPGLVLTDRTAVMRRYDAIRRRVEAKLPGLFERIPNADLEIRPAEGVAMAGLPGAFYLQASPGGERPGTFFVRVGPGGARTPGMEALFLHEAVPGHHLQTAFAQELDSLPRLRRFAHHTAFVEGWALYAESLGGDLGLFTDPYQRVGRLQSELLRAARLVLDVGIHDGGWTREKATERARTRLLGSGAWELDRYASDPAQALGYKVGEVRIRALRERAERELGAAFDLRAFHDVVLSGGSLPLDVLDGRVDAWIRAEAATVKPAPGGILPGPEPSTPAPRAPTARASNVQVEGL